MEYKISIIVPIFNVEEYLDASLNSVLEQTIGFENLEVIMVDDCSTDNSKKVMEDYETKYDNFKAIYLKQNSGAAGRPRNVGMAKATGKYLMFLDADDYYNPDTCEILYNKMVQEDVDIVFGNYVYVYDNRMHKYPNIFGEVDEVKVKTIDEEVRLLTLPPSLWTKIYKRNFIEDNKITFPEGIPAQDLVFIVHAFLKANGIIYLNKFYAVNYNRVRDSMQDYSVSRSKSMKNLMKTITSYSEAFELLKDNGKEEYFPDLFKGHLSFWADGFIVSDTKHSDRIELLKKISHTF